MTARNVFSEFKAFIETRRFPGSSIPKTHRTHPHNVCGENIIRFDIRGEYLLRNTSTGKTGFDATPKSGRKFIGKYQQSIIITIGLVEFLPQIRIACALRRLHVVLLNKGKDARRSLFQKKKNLNMQKFLPGILSRRGDYAKESIVREEEEGLHAKFRAVVKWL